MHFNILEQAYIKYPLLGVSNALQIFVFLAALFNLLLALSGFVRTRRRKITAAPQKRFAVVIPAHDEERVIGFALDSVASMDYPKELFDVYVVADHCSDGTAEIARAKGAAVIEHGGDKPRGKGYALRYSDGIILAAGKYDALCYFDADSLAHRDFLRAINAELLRGSRAIQAMEIAKNPHENWFTKVSHISQTMMNELYQMPKHRAGLGATLHGKGMCFTADTMLHFPWDGTCLTEDIELQARMTRHGLRIAYCPEALVYDEEPTDLTQMVNRFIRWTTGSIDVARRHLPAIYRRAIFRADTAAMEAAIRFTLSFRFILAATMALLIYAYADSFNAIIWLYKTMPGMSVYDKVAYFVPLLVLPMFILHREKAKPVDYAAYLVTPFFYFCISIPIFVASMCAQRKCKHEWYRTEHTSRLGINDMAEKDF